MDHRPNRLRTLTDDDRRAITAEEMRGYCQYVLDSLGERLGDITAGLRQQENPVILAESLSKLNRAENDLSRIAEALGSAPWLQGGTR